MEQKTILITGASRGIGKSIALRFASRGYHTFLNCSSSVDELKKLRAYIRQKYHTPCTIVVGDVGNPDHVRAIYNRIYHDCSHLDVLVNNAGISHIKTGIILFRPIFLLYFIVAGRPSLRWYQSVLVRSSTFLQCGGSRVLPAKLHTPHPNPVSTDSQKLWRKNSHQVMSR